MGTRYEDQPPEVWADPDSLDPTPVWKQFMLIGLLLLAGLGLVGGFAWLSLAVQLATPPAVVPGGRVVLARTQVPAVGQAVRVGAPLLDESQAFWLIQPTRNEVLAVRARWSPGADRGECPVETAAGGFTATCGDAFRFGPRGEPAAAPLALERYLVAIEGDRVVVNISRVIRGYGPSPQPLQPALTPYR